LVILLHGRNSNFPCLPILISSRLVFRKAFICIDTDTADLYAPLAASSYRSIPENKFMSCLVFNGAFSCVRVLTCVLRPEITVLLDWA